MKLKELLESTPIIDVPKKLYHATYKQFLKSIKKSGGLEGGKNKMWEDSKKKVVYLAIDKDVAESYMEDNDFLEELDDDEYDDYVDNIIVFEIDTSKLNLSLLKSDENVRNDDNSTFEYKGKIPLDAMKKL